MKLNKIMIMICVLFCTFIMNTKIIKADSQVDDNNIVSKPLIILKDERNPNLNYNNYQQVSSNLNPNISGKYQTVFKDNVTDKKIVKDIYVVNRNQVINKSMGIIEEKEYISSDEEIVKYVELDNGNKVIATKIINKTTSQDEPTMSYFLSGLKEDEVIWKTEIDSNCYSSITDIMIVDNEILVLGQRYFEPSKMDSFLMKYSTDGQLKKIAYYSGTSNETINKVIVTKDAYYLCGYTTSSNGDFTGVRKGEDSVLLKVKKDNLKIQKVIYYAEEYNDQIVDMCFYNGYIYLVKRYAFNSVAVAHQVIKVDLNGDIVKTYYPINNNSQRVLSIKVYNENIVLNLEDKTIDSECNASYTYILDENLKELKCFVYKYQEYHLYLIDSYLQEDKLTLLYSRNDKKSKGYVIRQIDLKQENVTINHYQEYNNDNLHLNDNLELIRYDAKKVYKIKNYIIEVKSLGTKNIYDKNTNINDYKIKLDGIDVFLSPQSKIDYNSSLYGIYENFYYFQSKNFDFCYFYDLNVLPNTSIDDGGLYDQNVIITFNGIGVLNGSQIESGHKVEESGNYILVIRGKDNQIKTYHFNVENLSIRIKPSCQEIIKNDDLVNLNDFKIETNAPSNKNEIDINLEEQKSDSKSNLVVWPLFIPASIAIIITFVIIKGSKR